jgi:hypothetical protein
MNQSIIYMFKFLPFGTSLFPKMKNIDLRVEMCFVNRTSMYNIFTSEERQYGNILYFQNKSKIRYNACKL